MKKLFTILWAVALIGWFTPKAGAADALKPDSAGYIRDWLMLAPVALPEGATGADSIAAEQVKNESAFKPKAGDTIKVGNKELTWTKITAATNYFDFNKILNSQNEQVAGYMVTYVECDKEMADLTMAISSNDEGRIYLNGKEVFKFIEARGLEIDADKVKVTLQKGVNVIVFKIVNETNDWQGAMRFLDKGGAPVMSLKIKLAP